MLSTDSMRKKRRRRSRKPCVIWRRRNERESFNQSRSERSKDRPDRGWSRHAGCARCGSGDARGAAFWFRQHEEQGRSRFVRGKAMAAERDRSRPCRLQVIADLAGWRRRFGPKPRDYSKKVGKSVRRLAFRKALSERINAGDVLTIDNFVVSELKTKAFVDLLKKQTDAKKVLIVSDSFDEKTYKSARNVKPVKLSTAADVNTEQLLAFQKILVTQKALEKLAERTR